MAERNWELIEGRCGVCVKFVKDYGGGEKVYGHCGVKPRAGSITSSTFKCEVYVPIEEFAQEEVAAPESARRPRSAVNPFDITADSPRRSTPQRPTRRSSPARVVVRKPSREERDHEPVDLGDGDDMDRGTLREIIREAIEDSLGIGEVELLDRFKGGTVVVQPADGSQAKEIPIDTLMRKVVMIRDNLRVLEQKINGNKALDDSEKVQLQQYITRCYGSLTTFNSLFKHRDDWFKGSGS